MKKFYMRLW